ncbi:pyridine nucleotide-disulfide family oxidoreductase [Enterococcus sp. AZ194]|uniref:NAD(P)/FAD-dependent oxidoreductase n=1 Tax=Enterococcus sp. AZ194 TaxID=2774629 RepID=UPI003F2528FB
MTEIVILGAGYAGLRTLKELQKSKEDVHITLVDQNTYHFEATDLHEVAAGTQSKEKITYEIKDVVNSEKTTFTQAKVQKIDRDNQKVTLDSGESLSYDYLVVALGFQSESFGIKGVSENALEMVDVDSAVKVHEHIKQMMQQYAATKEENYLKIVVCGAGFTGIELLGSLIEGKKEFAQIAGVSPEKIQIYCVEAVTRLLPMFDEKLADYAVKHLTDWGVQWRTGKPIKEIKPGVVVYQENAETGETKELAAQTIIWTTGVSGSHVIGESGFSERRGRVTVSADLTDPDHKNVYVIGDVSAVMDPETNRPYPTTAQIALKMGTMSAKNILHQLKGEKTEGFTFKSQGSVASIGNTHALGLVGKSAVKGYPASFIKKMIMNKSLLETGGIKEAMAKGRFDLYH